MSEKPISSNGYCLQCAGDSLPLVAFNERHKSFDNSGYLVRCLGCGITIVDENHRCIFKHCEKQHGHL